MNIKNPKTTGLDRKYFDEKARITEAAKAGKLGKSWFVKNEKNGKHELRPKNIYRKV